MSPIGRGVGVGVEAIGAPTDVGVRDRRGGECRRANEHAGLGLNDVWERAHNSEWCKRPTGFVPPTGPPGREG